MHAAAPALAAAALALGLTGACASRGTLTQRFRALDSDAKAEYLQKYPGLTPEGRLEHLEMLEARGISLPKEEYFGDELHATRLSGDSLALSAKSSGYVVRSPELWGIEIHATPRADGAIKLKSVLVYGDGRGPDITADTRWHVNSSMGRIDRDALLYPGCVAGPIEVTANFLDEREARLSVPAIRVPTKIRLEPAADVVETSGYLRLRVSGHCDDGTTADLTCKATYRTQGRPAEIEGCGTLHLASSCAPGEDQVTVTAAYGGLESSRVVHVPCALQRDSLR